MSKKNILIIILLIIIISGVFIFWKYIKIPKKIIQKEEINTPDRELIKNYSSLKLASLTEENVKNLHNECFNLDNLEVKHFAYESLFFSENRNIIGVDGKKENSYDNIVLFPGIKSRPNYVIGDQPIRYIGSKNQGKNWFLVENGEENSLPYDRILSFGYSSDGKHFAFAAVKGDKQFLIIDGVEKETLFDISHSTLNFSPNGDTFAYFAVKENEKSTYTDDQYLIVFNDKVVSSLAEPQHFDWTSFIFSPDYKHFAVTGYDGRLGDFLVLDGKIIKVKVDETCEYYHIGSLFFAPDNEHVFYVIDCVYSNDNKDYLVKNDEIISKNSYWDISSLAVSTDGKQIAYVGRHSPGEREVLVINDVEQPIIYDEVKSLAFSPDSKHLFFVAKKGESFLVVEDNNKESGIYDKIPSFYPFYFSPDYKYIGYGAVLNNELLWVVDEIQ